MIKNSLLTKAIALIVIVLFIGMNVPSSSTVLENELPTELIIEGPTLGKVGVYYEYHFYLTDAEGCALWLYVDWGDGTVEEWIGPYDPYEGAYLSHAWGESGNYTIFAGAKDCNDTYYATLNVTIIDNHPPDSPKIAGPVSGRVGEEYEYTFFTEDPDGDNVSYYIEWDDGTSTGWTSYFPSGAYVRVSHTWYRKGTYIIRCKAKDVYDFESDWAIYWPGITISEANYDLCLFEVKGNISKSSKWQEPIFFIGKWFNKNNRYNLFLSASLVIMGDKNEKTLLIQDLIDEDLSDVYHGNIEIKIKLFIGVIEPSEGICKGFFYRATVY